MLIGEEMFTWGQEGGEGGLGNSQNVSGSSQEQDGERSGIRPDYAS